MNIPTTIPRPRLRDDLALALLRYHTRYDRLRLALIARGRNVQARERRWYDELGWLGSRLDVLAVDLCELGSRRDAMFRERGELVARRAWLRERIGRTAP